VYRGRREKAFALGAGCRRQREILTRHAKGDAHSDVILHHQPPLQSALNYITIAVYKYSRVTARKRLIRSIKLTGGARLG
jgi:hypothetical protein